MEISKSNKTYLSVEEVAERFCVNPTTIYRLAQRRVIPGFKIGSQWRFSRDMLDAWVSNHVDSKKLSREDHDAKAGKK